MTVRAAHHLESSSSLPDAAPFGVLPLVSQAASSARHFETRPNGFVYGKHCASYVVQFLSHADGTPSQELPGSRCTRRTP